jgi:hypothetical protein
VCVCVCACACACMGIAWLLISTVKRIEAILRLEGNFTAIPKHVSIIENTIFIFIYPHTISTVILILLLLYKLDEFKRINFFYTRKVDIIRCIRSFSYFIIMIINARKLGLSSARS